MQSKAELELIELFVANARKAVAEVERITRKASALNNILIRITDEDNFVLLSEPDDIDSELFSIFRTNSKVVTQPTKEQLATIKTGVTDAFCGVAKTGSVCVSVTENLSSPVSMLTHKHIVVVDSKTIVPRASDVFTENYLNGKGLTRSFTFITGSSATADMGPLVRGVHGPGKLHIIILE